MRDLYKKTGLKKQDTGLVMQWARDGELVQWNPNQGNKPSPIFALVGDDRIPKDAGLITEEYFNCIYCPYWRIVSRGNGGC